jgi:hypothetical protein
MAGGDKLLFYAGAFVSFLFGTALGADIVGDGPAAYIGGAVSVAVFLIAWRSASAESVDADEIDARALAPQGDAGEDGPVPAADPEPVPSALERPSRSRRGAFRGEAPLARGEALLARGKEWLERTRRFLTDLDREDRPSLSLRIPWLRKKERRRHRRRRSEHRDGGPQP